MLLSSVCCLGQYKRLLQPADCLVAVGPLPETPASSWWGSPCLPSLVLAPAFNMAGKVR